MRSYDSLPRDLQGIRTVLPSLVWMLSLAFPAAAHHSYSMFDFAKGPVTLQGVVTEFQWGNPHVFIEIDVPGENAAVTHYSIESTAPASLLRKGWRHDSLKSGDKVIAVIYPLRDGRNGGTLYKLTLADGRTLETGLETVIREHQGQQP